MKHYLFISIGLFIVFAFFSQQPSYSMDNPEKRAIEVFESKNFFEAIILFSEIINNNPNNTNAFAYRAHAKQNLKDHRGAIVDFNKAILLAEKEIDFPKDNLSILYSNRGMSKAILKSYNEALIDFKTAISLDPKNAYAYLNMGFAKIDNGDKEGGCADLSRAGELGLIEAYNAISKECL